MNLRWLIRTAIPFIQLALITGQASGAEFSPAIEDELAAKGITDMVSAIIILESPLDIRALDERLHSDNASLAVRHLDVMNALKYNAEMTQPEFRDEFDKAVAGGQMTGYTAYWIENLFVVQATKQFLEGLRGRGDIKYVTENFEAELIEPIKSITEPGSAPRRGPNSLDNETTTPGQDATGATQINRELGLTGQGVLVASLDTGVEGAHGALASRWRGNFAPYSECWKDAVGYPVNFPTDQHGHGTHVMGTICGREIIGVDTNTVGAAPNAQWIACNAIHQNVSPAFDNDIIDAFQWLTDPDGNAATLDDVPDVIRNSWGVNTSLDYIQCFDFWNTVILNCAAAGPVITWSAGNESTSGLRSPAIYSLSAYQYTSSEQMGQFALWD